MRKTNKELAEFYGIKVGDKVKIYYREDDTSLYSEYELVCDEDNMIELRSKNGWSFDLLIIGTRRYEVIKPKKKYGDTKCKDYYNCKDCPLRIFECTHAAGNTLYGVLEKTCIDEGYSTDHPIYKAYKAELDKEVE